MKISEEKFRSMFSVELVGYNKEHRIFDFCLYPQKGDDVLCDCCVQDGQAHEWGEYVQCDLENVGSVDSAHLDMAYAAAGKFFFENYNWRQMPEWYLEEHGLGKEVE